MSHIPIFYSIKTIISGELDAANVPECTLPL